MVRLGAAPEKPPATGFGLAVGDEEALPFAAESLDLAVSALSLQFVNDLPGVLAQIRRALRPDGLFLAALLGGETLRELGEVLRRGGGRGDRRGLAAGRALRRGAGRRARCCSGPASRSPSSTRTASPSAMPTRWR